MGSSNAVAQLSQQLQPGTYYLAVTAAADNPSGNQTYLLDSAFESALPPFQGVPVGNNPEAVAVGDLNHDGNLDFVTANVGDDTVSVVLGNGDGTFQPAAIYPVGSGPAAVVVADLNHDGNLDLVTANTGALQPGTTVSVLLGKGDGTFGPAATYVVGSGPHSVAVGDFNHDGNLDLVTANFVSRTASVLLGNGDGTFGPAVDYAVGQDASLRGSG